MAPAAVVSPQIEAGNVYLPDPGVAPWITGFIEECAAFPNGAYDDQVDAMSQALVRLGAWRNLVPTVRQRKPSLPLLLANVKNRSSRYECYPLAA